MTHSAPLLQLKDIRLAIGSTTLFRHVDLAVSEKARLCLVGRNGSGKSTLMRLIAGLVEEDGGELTVQPGTRIAYMPQEPQFPADTTALAYVTDQPHATKHQSEALLDALGIAYDKSLNTLSGGEARRVSLAHALVSEPDILMLDEPTNHLDIATIQWLEKYMNRYPGSLILISHDRTFLANTTTATLWLDQGEIRRLNKGYGHFQEWMDKLLEEEARAQVKLDKLIESETEWSHAGITARRKRNQGRLARLKELRQQRAQHLRHLKMSRLEASSAEMSSRSIIEAREISKLYGDRILFKDFTTFIARGDRIGIIGPNGSGKTTLLKILIGELKPDEGKVKVSKQLRPVYLDQNRTKLDPKKSLLETVAPQGNEYVEVMGRRRHAIGYLKDFLFHPDQVRGPVGVLSGGEKNRLFLALSLAQDSNMLILDEPTNDLDMDTLDRLQDMLANYDGTLIVVSHDRAFLDNVVTSTIVLEGDGTAIEYAGGYADYLLQKKGSKKQPEKTKDSSKTKKERTKEKSAKLSFKDKYALEHLPKEIAELEDKLTTLNAQLSDPTLYTQNPEKAKNLAKEAADLKAKKEDLEEKWLVLELRREELEEN